MTQPPNVGDVVFLGPDQFGESRVVHVEGTRVTVVPIDTRVRFCHQGNLYNAQGKGEWRI